MIDINNREAIFNPLLEINPEAKPKFGTMTPQHMIEHLTLAVRQSNGKTPVRIYTPAEKLPAMKAFLMSEKSFPAGFKAPMLGDGLLPLRYAGIREAVAKLSEELSRFDAYFKEHPETMPNHPVFGPLNYAEWQRAHNKHFTHHFRQFGLNVA